MGKFECSCGADYSLDLARDGYPKWHAPRGKPIHFVDECCTLDCGQKVCHACATTCKICKSWYCLDHTTADLNHFGLCEQCIGVYPEIPAGPERDTLIEVEARLQSSSGSYYRVYSANRDLAKMLEIAKEALATKPWVLITTIRCKSEECTGRVIGSTRNNIGDPPTDLWIFRCDKCGAELGRA